MIVQQLLGPSGVNEGSPFSFQPDGSVALTLNCRGHEPGTDRDRLGRRPGLTRITTTRIGGGAVQDINHLTTAITVN